MIERSERQPLYRWAWVLFFFSGLTGLIYQILWTRRLTLVFGHSILAVSTVVTAYMGGLALGSWLGGRRADRKVREGVSGGWFVKAYGILEGFVGLWAILSLQLLNWIETIYFSLSAQGIQGYAVTLLVFTLSLLALLPPTMAMGATLPVVGCLFSDSQEGVGTKLSRLYSINTWGAVCGAGLAGFGMLPAIGLKASIFLAAAINLAIGFFAHALGRRHSHKPEPKDRPVEGKSPSTALLPWIFGLCGFSSMALQLGWTRGLALCLGGAVYSFSAILVVFLSGIALGSLLYPWVFRDKRVTVGWIHLAWLCLLMALTGALSVVLVGNLPLAFAKALPLFSDHYSKVLLLNLLLSGVVLLPPTLLMGLSFPLVTHLYHRHNGALGKSIGNIYGANTLGCILGSFSAGFIGLPLVGVENTLRIAVSCYLLAAVASCWLSQRNKVRSATLGLVAGLALATWILPPWNTGLTSAGVAVYAGTTQSLLNRPNPLFYQDGLTCSVAFEFVAPDMPVLRVNGKIDASLGLSDRINMYLTGLIPLLYVENPSRVGVIGLGGGLTLTSVAGSPRVNRVDCAELEPAVIEVQKYWAPYVESVHQNPKVKLLEADGRTFILGAGENFDIIISEPSNPWIAGIGNLYTREFYQNSKKKLSDDGVFLQWCNLYAISPDDLNMVLRSFFQCYEHGDIWLGGGDLMLIGSKKPLQCKTERLREYWEQHPTLKYELAELGFLEPEEILGQFISSWDFAKSRVGPGPVNSDDRPLLEYSAPRSLYRKDSVVKNLQWVLALREASQSFPGGLEPSKKERLQARLGNFACLFRDMVKIPKDQADPSEYADFFALLQQMSASQPLPEKLPEFLRKYPNFTRSRLEWARRALESELYQETLGLIGNTSYDESPQASYFALWLRASACLRSQQWALAIDPLLELYKMRPLSKTASELSSCYRMAESWEESKKWADQALQLNPYDCRAMLELGMGQLQTKNWQGARPLIEEALKICPRLVEGWLQLARIHAQEGKRSQARQALEKAIRFAPDEKSARQLQEFLGRSGL